MTYSPTVRRRRLSLALRRFRKEAGLTGEQIAKTLGWPTSKVARMMRNEWRLPAVSDVLDVLKVCGVTDPAILEAMESLARQGRQRGWWDAEGQRDALGGALPEFEHEASEIHTVQTILIGGLLQTPEYAAAVFRGGQVLDDDIVQRRVVARMARQAILDRPAPPHLWTVIDESALLRHVGGVEVMRAQLRHLRAMAERPNITIQVLPLIAGAHASMSGPCTVLIFPSPDDPDLVFMETPAGELFLEKPDEVARYRARCDHVRASAMSEQESAIHLEKLIKPDR